jgi:hypothetical protein
MGREMDGFPVRRLLLFVGCWAFSAGSPEHERLNGKRSFLEDFALGVLARSERFNRHYSRNPNHLSPVPESPHRRGLLPGFGASGGGG